MSSHQDQLEEQQPTATITNSNNNNNNDENDDDNHNIMNDLLDEALDELEELENSGNQSQQQQQQEPKAKKQQSQQPKQQQQEEQGNQKDAKDIMVQALESFLTDLDIKDNNDDNHSKKNKETTSKATISSTQQQPEKNKSDIKPSSKGDKNQKEKTTPPGQANPDLQAAMAAMLEGMVQHNSDDNGDGDDNDLEFPPQAEALMKELFGDMMGDLDGDGNGDGSSSHRNNNNTPDALNSDALLNGMMEQLLSKELMYEPIQQVTQKFPQWLSTHQPPVVSEEEYQKRCQQFQCFQQLLNIYDTEPNNMQAVLDHMQHVQEYGQPPDEIIQEIAPGLSTSFLFNDNNNNHENNTMEGLPPLPQDCGIM